MKKLFFITAVCFCAGCTTQYSQFTSVDASNGINIYEAVLIADEEMVKADFQNYFQVIRPVVRQDKAAKKYPRYWFVDYTPEVWMDFTSYLVVIDKQTGEVVRAREYYWPARRADLDWIFKSTEFRQNTSLTPGD